MQMTMSEASVAVSTPKSAPPKTDSSKTSSSSSNDKSFQSSLDAKVQVDRENQKAAANDQQNAANTAAYGVATSTPVVVAQQEINLAMAVANIQTDSAQGNSLQQTMQDVLQTLQQMTNQVEKPVSDLIQQLQSAAAGQQAQTTQTIVKVEVQVNTQVSLQSLAQQEAGSQAAANLNLNQVDTKDQSASNEKLVLPVTEKPAAAVDTTAAKVVLASQVQTARPGFLSQLNLMQNQDNSAKTDLLLNQLADRLKTAVEAGKDVVKIQLQPENMGKVDVRIVRGSDGVQFYFTADTPTTTRALQSSLNQLHQSLVDAGVKVGNMSVAYQGQPGQQNNQGQSQRKNGFLFGGTDDSDLAVDYSSSSALSALDTRA